MTPYQMWAVAWVEYEQGSTLKLVGLALKPNAVASFTRRQYSKLFVRGFTSGKSEFMINGQSAISWMFPSIMDNVHP